MDKARQRLTALREFWDKKRNAKELPRRGDFDPKALRPWIGNLALVEIVPDGEMLFRLCGTNLYGRLGGEFTGRDVNSLPSGIAEQFCEGVRHACRTRTPFELTHRLVMNGEAKSFCDVYLPLSDDNARVKIVLFASFEGIRK